MKLVIIGPPGAGKGTYTDKLVEKYGLKHISLGDLLRAEVATESELGNKLGAIMEKGDLVPDDISTELLQKAIDGVDNFMIDGYPRTEYQAGQLVEITPLDAVILLEVPDEVVKTRLGGRWSCPKCKAIYHEISLKPKVEGICDKCGAELTQRKDDTPEGIQERLNIFHENGVKIVKHFEERKVLLRINGVGNPDDVVKDIISKLEKFVNAQNS